MTNNEMMKIVGETGIMNVEGLSFEVKVLEVREVAEDVRYLIKPICGSGTKWVAEDRVIFEPLEIFLKNVLDTDIDGINNTIRYVVKAQYNVRKEDERGSWYELDHRLIEDVTLTWDEVEEEGGPGEIKKELTEIYNL